MSNINAKLGEMIREAVSAEQEILKRTRGLKDKWEQSGLLDDLPTNYEKHSMAVLLENQAKQILKEASATGTDSNSEQWSGVALPLVRRIFGEIAAKEFVSVQPMNIPSGLVFYVDFRYSSGQAGKPAFSGSSIYGADAASGKLGSTQTATGGLYGPGRFGYSINDISASGLSLANAGQPVAAAFVDIDFVTGNTLSASMASSTLYRYTVEMSGSQAAFDKEGVRAFTISGPGIVDYYPAYTKVSGNNVTFMVSGSINLLSSSITSTVEYHNQPADNSRGDFEDTAGTDIGIPQVDIELKSEQIIAKTRKLKAVWTPEISQDLSAYHSVNAEDELSGLLADYVSLEIDLEILEMLQLNALTTEYWSVRVGTEYNPATNLFAADADAVAASAYTKMTWFQTLGNKIQKVSNRIHQLTLRGGANFMVCSPDVATILESIPGFTPNTDGDQRTFPFGITQVGAFRSRFSVWKNPYMTENVILMGFKGNTFLDTGAVYAPYVPLIMTPVVLDPDNFTPRRGVMTRYAKHLIRPEFYGKVVVGHLNEL